MSELTYDVTVKVLLVDDEENILRALKRLLVDEDVVTLFATSGEKALEIMKDEEDIGLIISDQRMPGLSGTDFLEAAKRLRPLATRILLTGYSDINAAIDAINRGGASRYLTKPWNDGEIRQVVREARQRYALIQKNKYLSAVVQRQNEELKNWSKELEIHVQQQTIELSRQNDTLKKLNERMRGNFKNTILALSSLIELRDKKVRSHSRHVAEIAAKTALAMGLSQEEVETITVASLLHDIGKIGMSDVLLAKDTGDLGPKELQEYFLHPVRGQAAVDAIEDLRGAGLLIRHHHETFDGSGFPDGLKADQIPPGARIIAMADFIDRHQGRNRDKPPGETLTAVHELLGSRFDAKVFNYIAKPTLALYAQAGHDMQAVERELMPGDLKEGMVVSRDVHSGSGLVLISKGARLNTANILAIRRYYSIDPPQRGIYIWSR